MKPTDDINKLIKKLHIKASSELNRKVNDDISKTMMEPAFGVNIWRTKLAIAAAIIVAFGIGFAVGQRTQPAQSLTYSTDISGYTSEVSVYPTIPKAAESFWQQKALAAMQPRPYSESQFERTNLLNTYKQYLKEKHYD